MDHGLLNLPLAKRGNIDAQIDAYKATQAAMKKAAAKVSAVTLKADRIAAKARINAMSLERFAELGKTHGLTALQCKAQFKHGRRTAKLTPEVFRGVRRSFAFTRESMVAA